MNEYGLSVLLSLICTCTGVLLREYGGYYTRTGRLLLDFGMVSYCLAAVVLLLGPIIFGS